MCVYMLLLTQMKLELVTGASAATMNLTVFDKDNKLVCILDNNDALLGSYPIDSGMRIHVWKLKYFLL